MNKLSINENNILLFDFDNSFDDLFNGKYTSEEDDPDSDSDSDSDSKEPALKTYGTDITKLAHQGKLDDCFGREKELSQLMEILVRRQKNNPVLTGDAGVGKTAIVELLANKIVNNTVPYILSGRSIISIDLARILAGSRYRGEFEQRFQRVLDEILAHPNIIMFVDEIHNLGGTGSAEGSLDAANILKPVLARSGFQCIGATTTKEYQKIEKDAALNRRFQPIKVAEPSVEDTVNILYGLRNSLECFHNLEFIPSALRLAVELSERYIQDRFLPDKAIDIVDRAAAREVIKLTTIENNSVFSTVANKAIQNIGKLRLEAFRRGDIASEYIFQEVENAYRNFLIQWIENPSSLPDKSKTQLVNETLYGEKEAISEQPIKGEEKDPKKKLEENEENKNYDLSQPPAWAWPDKKLAKRTFLSPVAESFFDKIRLSVLTRMDELLFASNKTRTIIRKMLSIRRLSNEKCFQILYSFTRNLKYHLKATEKSEKIKKFFLSILSLKKLAFLDFVEDIYFSTDIFLPKLNFPPNLSSPRKKIIQILVQSILNLEISTYRITSFLNNQLRKLQPTLVDLITNEVFSNPLLITNESLNRVREAYNLMEKYKMPTFSEEEEKRISFLFYKYLCQIKKNLKKENILFYNREQDFIPEDIETYHESFETLSELEEKRINVVKDFLTDLRPILKKGIVCSLAESSDLSLSYEDQKLIYTLLGYFSTDTGRSFLSDIDDPEIVRRARYFGDFSALKKRIDQNDIRTLLSTMTGIPIQSLTSDETEKLINLEENLHTRVIGQHEAISAIAKAIRRSRLGMQNPNRPIASFFFCGPTGVGKTEVTKALAEALFGSENDMIRFDMSEFMEKFTISRLIGSPPGYIGYDDGGELTDAVRRKPYSVVLFDEIEKAHPDILNILLQVLEDGRLTDSQKRLISFENTVIIMTSNAAADEIQQILKTEDFPEDFENQESNQNQEIKESQITNIETTENEKNKKTVENNEYTYLEDPYSGIIRFLKSPITEDFLTDIQKQLELEFKKSIRQFDDPKILKKELRKYVRKPEEKNLNRDELKKRVKEAVLARLSTMFLPEFLNRLDDIIIFEPLNPNDLRKICNIMVKQVTKRVSQNGVVLNVSDRVKLQMTREGYNPSFGARPLRRLMTKNIEDLVSDTVLKDPGNEKSRNIIIDLNKENKVVATLVKSGPITEKIEINQRKDIKQPAVIQMSYENDTLIFQDLKDSKGTQDPKTSLRFKKEEKPKENIKKSELAGVS
jgi:ATP-dependent Clp protease ATP-binding subunit ClpA